jgi:hypothetical protein
MNRKTMTARSMAVLIFVLSGVALVTAFVSVGTAGGVGAQDGSLVRLSDDTFTNPSSQHHTEVEPDTFAFGSTWVSAFQMGLSLANGSSGIGFATSLDRGQTFIHGVLPGITSLNGSPGPYDFAADASVAFDRRDRVWLISYLAVHDNPSGGIAEVDVLVSRSGDAVHWDLPVPVATPLNVSLDKNWTVCDNSPSSPWYGNCYTEFNGPAPGSPLDLTTSSDAGLTWDAPLTPGPGSAGQPLVQPSGRVVVPFVGGLGPHCDQPTTGANAQVCAVSSNDGGSSWTEPAVISPRTFHPTQPALRSPPEPTAAVDRDGRIYVVWKDCRFEAHCFDDRSLSTNDLVLSTSDDGTHWSDVQRIPLDPVGSNVDHFVPGLGVDPESADSTARLALTYYFLPDASCLLPVCKLAVGFVSSTDGGRTWTQPDVLGDPMQLGWLAETHPQGRMFGDYISTSVFNGGALVLPAFAVAAQPGPDGTFDEAIYTARESVRDGDVAGPTTRSWAATQPAAETRP